MVVAVSELNDSTRAWIAERFGKRTTLVMTSPLDIRKTIERFFGAQLEEKSRLSLWNAAPHASARITMPPSTRAICYLALCAAIALTAYYPIHIALCIMGFCSLSYCITMIIKATIFAQGTKRPAPPNWQALLAALDEKILPVYSILIPMYREAESLPGMLEAMQRMDYPSEKLDIKIVLEADDSKTLAAAHALKPRYQFDIICVPPGPLRTKPKACNYALRFCHGEYVTIFDADDRPDTLQLKKSVIAFKNAAPDVACLQARLNYYNANDNLLTRFFTIEYAMLFEVMLYGLQRLAIPLPLGGTSNHLSLARLRALGEWDPYNVTEDADLGVRLAILGFRTEMLDSYTLEEAPNSIPAWVRQRSRWIKGYMQTWLVHMRKPRLLYRALGARSFWGFQFFVGFSTFTFLTAPIVWGIALGWWVLPTKMVAIHMPYWLLGLTTINFLLNFVTHWYMTAYCIHRYTASTAKMKWAAFLFPFYLVLHSAASYKSLWQLIVKPHFWEKTTHGLAKQFAPLISQEIPLTAAR